MLHHFSYYMEHESNISPSKGYNHPAVKVITVKATNVLCVSGSATERFTVNEDNSLNDSDWD